MRRRLARMPDDAEQEAVIQRLQTRLIKQSGRLHILWCSVLGVFVLTLVVIAASNGASEDASITLGLFGILVCVPVFLLLLFIGLVWSLSLGADRRYLARLLPTPAPPPVE